MTQPHTSMPAMTRNSMGAPSAGSKARTDIGKPGPQRSMMSLEHGKVAAVVVAVGRPVVEAGQGGTLLQQTESALRREELLDQLFVFLRPNTARAVDKQA